MQKKHKDILILEEKLDALARHLGLKLIAEYEEEGDWVDVEVIRRKKNKWKSILD